MPLALTTSVRSIALQVCVLLHGESAHAAALRCGAGHGVRRRQLAHESPGGDHPQEVRLITLKQLSTNHFSQETY